MPTVFGYHDVKDKDHWLASPKREEFFGPLGVTNIRTFVDPENPKRVGVLMDVSDMDAVMGARAAPNCERDLRHRRGLHGRDGVDVPRWDDWLTPSRPWPSGVSTIAYSTRTPSSPTTRSTHPPSTCPSPCSSSPSTTKNAVAASRSSTTMPTCSMRWIVMRSPGRI